MKKDKEVEMVDSKEAEVDLMEKMVELIVLCKIRENLNGRMMIRTRPSGKVVAHTEEVLDLTEEEVILIIKVVFVVIVLDVVKKDTNPLSLDLLKVGKVTKMLWYKVETLRVHLVGLRLEKI